MLDVSLFAYSLLEEEKKRIENEQLLSFLAHIKWLTF